MNEKTFADHAKRVIDETQRDGSNFGKRPAVFRAQESLVEHVKSLNLIRENQDLLDVGCGGGDFCKIFMDSFKIRAHGLTIDQEEKRTAELLGIDVVTADMHDIPFPSETFDLVLASHVLEHSISPIIALSEWRRILKKDGVIIVWGPVGRDFEGKDDGTCVYGCKDHLITPTLWQYKWLFKLTHLSINVEFDLPYQISNDKMQRHYSNLRKKRRVLNRFKLDFIQRKIPGTAQLFILEKEKE